MDDLLARINETLNKTAPPPPPAKPKITGRIPVCNASQDELAAVFVYDGDEAAATKRAQAIIEALDKIPNDPMNHEKPRPQVPPHVDTSHVKACLSGAFEEAVDVVTLNDGAMAAAIPIEKLNSCGLKFVPTIVPTLVAAENSQPGADLCFSVLTGSPEAATNARNRVAKPLGEGWKVALHSFSIKQPKVYFRIERA